MLEGNQETESRVRTIFKAAGMAICLIDAEERILECNPGMAAMFGYSAEEFRQKTFRDILHPDDIQEWESLRETLALNGVTRRTEKTCIRRDGKQFPSVLTVSVVVEANRARPSIVAMIEDASERKHAKASQEHEEASIRASVTGLWDWNLTTNQVYYSPGWKSQLGYEEHEISSSLDEWSRRLHPEDRRAAFARVASFLENPWPHYESETRMLHKDGTYRWILTRASLLRTPDGKPWRMLGSHVDITERRKNEERLREYEKVVEGLQEMVAVVDRDYRYLIANRVFTGYRKMDRAQVVGQLIPDILGNEVFHQIVKPKLDQCFEGRRIQYETSYTYPDIGERQLLITYLPIEGSGGIDRVACVLEDVTVRKRAERDLREAHQQLTAELQERTQAEQRVRALTERLITAQEEERRHIARELHDDLSQEIATLGILMSSLKSRIPEQDQELLSQADAIQQRVIRLADEVRLLARRLHPAVLGYLGVAAALQAYASEFTVLNGVTITVESSGVFEDVPAPVELCVYRVAQEALQNVARHANTSTATVRIERSSGFIRLVIQDSGCGFEDPQTGAGHGLGLVSMSERVRLVNGVLSVRSSLGRGTTVTATIPC